MTEPLTPPPTDTDWLQTESSRGPSLRDRLSDRVADLTLWASDFLPAWSRWGRRITELEIDMSKIREDFESAKTELGSAITGLAARIQELPGASDITQADIDGLKASASALNQLAVADPDIPTEGTPETPATPAEPTSPETPADPESTPEADRF